MAVVSPQIHPSIGAYVDIEGFTMKSSSCIAPGCPFSGGGKPGPCTNTTGILSAIEIRKVVAGGAKITLDSTAAVKVITWDDDQWVSYDDGETMKMK